MPRRSSALRASLLFAASLLGCETPDEDYPLGGAAIRIEGTQLGMPTAVSVAQQTDEWQLCQPRVGEFGPWIDCEAPRQREARLESIACIPAESCRDAKVDGAKGSFFALAERFSVKVVANIEGIRVETTRAVEAAKSAVHLSIRPEHAVEGAAVEVCRSADTPATTLSVSVAGASLAPAARRSDREGCVVFVPPVAGTLTASLRLASPALDLEPVTATVHSRAELHDVSVLDLQCSHRRAYAVGAYAVREGKQLIRVSAYGFVSVPGESGTGRQLYLPSSAIRLRDGDRVVASTGAPEESSASFVLDGAPTPDARIEVDLGGRVVTAPVVAAQCQ